MDPVSKYIQIECKPPPAEKSERPSDEAGVENKSQLLKYTHTQTEHCNQKGNIQRLFFFNPINLIKRNGETWWFVGENVGGCFVCQQMHLILLNQKIQHTTLFTKYDSTCSFNIMSTRPI